MALNRCRWVYDRDVPSGRFLVPGCWNRATRGDDADCHCEGGEVTIQEDVQSLKMQVAELRAALRGKEG